MEKNYFYKILGVSPDASKKEIEEGFHRALKSYHPDSGASNDEMVKEVLQAYRVLSDEEKRKEYDRNQMRGTEQKWDSESWSEMEKKRQSDSDWIQREYDSIERREVIIRLKEGERVASEEERILGSITRLQPKLKAKKGWGLYGLVSAFVIPWILMCTNELMSYHWDPMEYIYDLLFALIPGLPYVAVGVRKMKKNEQIEKYNAEEQERTLLEKKKILAKAQEYLAAEGKALQVLPKRFQYARAFCGIRELIEDGRADSMKEAINLYEQTRYQKDVVSGIRTINAMLASIASELQEVNVKIDLI